jgi:hypothetical protein
MVLVVSAKEKQLIPAMPNTEKEWKIRWRYSIVMEPRGIPDVNCSVHSLTGTPQCSPRLKSESTIYVRAEWMTKRPCHATNAFDSPLPIIISALAVAY